MNALGWNHIGSSASWTVRRYVATARYNFFLNSTNNRTWAPPWQEIYPHDYILAAVTCIGMYFRQQMAFFADGLILTNCLLLWVNATRFRHLLEKTGSGDDSVLSCSQILKSYETLKELATMINSTTAQVVLIFSAQALFHYSISLNGIFIASNYLERFRIFSFLMIAGAVFFFAGDSCRQVEGLGRWLSARKGKTGDFPTGEELALILHEVKEHEVGISGKWFVLDFSAIFNVSAEIIRVI